MTEGLARSFVLLFAIIPPLVAQPAQAIERQTGRLAELIVQLAGRDYVLGEPSRDPRPYVDPSPVLHAFRHVAAAMAWGDVDVAARKAKEFDYEVVKFTDDQSQRDYLVLREDLDEVPAARGWGSYIINPQSEVNAIIEVPHPLADMHTPEIGGRVFEACGAKGFLLAGTHRDKADVPDLVDSIFHQVHAAWVGPFAQMTAWQIHGFLSVKHPFPQDTKVVASTGDGTIVPEIAALDTVLEENGVPSYAFNDLPAGARENKRINGGEPGLTFTSLAATKNEQGRLSRSLGGSFVHIELEGDVRASAENRQVVSAAIATVIRGDAPVALAEAKTDIQLASAETPAADVATPVAAPVHTPAATDGAAAVQLAMNTDEADHSSLPTHPAAEPTAP